MRRVRWFPVFIEKHRARPFFLNYWMFSVHAPFDAKRSLVEKYRKRVDPKDEQRSPTYAAMIESLDDAVGTLLSALDRWKAIQEQGGPAPVKVAPTGQTAQNPVTYAAGAYPRPRLPSLPSDSAGKFGRY